MAGRILFSGNIEMEFEKKKFIIRYWKYQQRALFHATEQQRRAYTGGGDSENSPHPEKQKKQSRKLSLRRFGKTWGSRADLPKTFLKTPLAATVKNSAAQKVYIRAKNWAVWFVRNLEADIIFYSKIWTAWRTISNLYLRFQSLLLTISEIDLRFRILT